jgi:hypothetical protein
MTLGAFRQQIGAMQANLDASLAGLASSNAGAVANQYAQMSVAYGGVSKELAELYPLRCPRLLADRIGADAAILAPRIDTRAARLALEPLRAGVAAIGTDLDQRMKQASPNGVVGKQDEATVDAPVVTGSPAWSDQQTRDLATRACSACHSNSPGWSWYANIAPLSWAVQHDVDAGRAALNFSEWDQPQPNAMAAAASVQSGRMPPAWAAAIDPRMRLTNAERNQLLLGLTTTMTR